MIGEGGKMQLMSLDYYDDLKKKISRDFEILPEDKLKRHIAYLKEERKNYIDYAKSRIIRIKDKTIKKEAPLHDIDTLQQIIEREQDVLNHIDGLLRKWQITIAATTPVNVEKGRFRQANFFTEKEKEIERAFENRIMKTKKLARWIKKEIELLQFEKEIIIKGIENYETIKSEGWQSAVNRWKEEIKPYDNFFNKVEYLLGKWDVNIEEPAIPVDNNAESESGDDEVPLIINENKSGIKFDNKRTKSSRKTFYKIFISTEDFTNKLRNKLYEYLKTKGKINPNDCSQIEFNRVWESNGTPIIWHGNRIELAILINILITNNMIRVPKNPLIKVDVKWSCIESGKQFYFREAKKLFKKIRDVKPSINNKKYSEFTTQLTDLFCKPNNRSTQSYTTKL